MPEFEEDIFNKGLNPAQVVESFNKLCDRVAELEKKVSGLEAREFSRGDY